MCSAAASVSRTASAAQTLESMPPLSNTTERGFLSAFFTGLFTAFFTELLHQKRTILIYGNYYFFRWPGNRNSCPLYFLIIAKLECSSWVAPHHTPLVAGSQMNL